MEFQTFAPWQYRMVASFACLKFLGDAFAPSPGGLEGTLVGRAVNALASGVALCMAVAP